jgi:hypothetical protein
MNFPVFRGIEARSDFGDMLVFGYYKDIPEGISDAGPLYLGSFF